MIAHVRGMNTENHIAIIFASLLWSISSALALCIFWPFVAIASLGVGFIVAKLLKAVVVKHFIFNGLLPTALVALVVFILGVIGFTQKQWQAMLYLVAFLQVISFYFGGLLYRWKYRASSNT